MAQIFEIEISKR